MKLLAEHPEVDGIICASDHIAHGVMRAARESGKCIPKDISIVGVGDSWADMISDPQLTTAEFYYEECGKEAGNLLLEMINDQEKAKHVKQIKLGYSIIERGSV